MRSEAATCVAWTFLLAIGLQPGRPSAQSGAQSGTPEPRTFSLPKPTGPYGIGRVSVHWTDESRHESLSADPTAHRELMVHLSYPTRPDARGEPAPYFPRIEQVRAYEDEHFGKDFMRGEYGPVYDSLFTARTHAIEGAALADGKERFPVLVFQPGGGVKIFLYTAILEELVSHGYVVAAVEPPYDTSVVVFPDGHAVEQHDDYGTVFVSGTPRDSARFHLGRIDVDAADDSFVLDQLRRLDEGAIRIKGLALEGRLDVERAGVFGHSQGGLAARRSCQLDGRWKGGIDLGGGLTKEELETMGREPIQGLFLLMTPSLGKKELIEADDALLRDVTKRGFKASVEAPGFGHFIYYDFETPEAAKEASRNGLAESARLRDTEIIRGLVRAFFDHSVRGGAESLWTEAAARLPEVELETLESSK